jgi:hypothetical protein
MPTSRVPRAQDGMTALLWAVDFERTEILSILIAAGASLETENNVRQRASCTACSGMAVFPGALCARRVSFCGVQCVVRIHRTYVFFTGGTGRGDGASARNRACEPHCEEEREWSGPSIAGRRRQQGSNR